MDANKKVSKIKLIFENISVCELDKTMFSQFFMSGIKNSFLINCYQYGNGENEKRLSCEMFYIEINLKGLKQLCSLENFTLEERLKIYNDITSVEIYYDNGTVEAIYVPWNDENDFENKYQKNYFRKAYNNEENYIRIEIERK